MRIPTVQDCPSCPGVKLQFDTDSQAYDCGNGHAFADLPEVQPAAVAAPVVSESRTVAPVVEPKTVETGRSLPPPPSVVVVVADVAAVDPVQPASIPAGEDQNGEIGASSLVVASVGAALAHEDQKTVAAPAAMTLPVVAPARGPELAALLAAQPPVRCANGDWLVVVRLPEMPALDLIAEAEMQRMTLGEYFGRAVGWLIANDSFRGAGI